MSNQRLELLLNIYTEDIKFHKSIGTIYTEEKLIDTFKLRINGTFVNVIASRGMGWEHVSVSQPSKTPSWEIMAKVKEMFFEEEEVVIQYHPKKSEYINNHKHCLHLWRPIDKEIITPPTWMIGFKELN